jgi:hypothetical protein
MSYFSFPTDLSEFSFFPKGRNAEGSEWEQSGYPIKLEYLDQGRAKVDKGDGKGDGNGDSSLRLKVRNQLPLWISPPYNEGSYGDGYGNGYGDGNQNYAGIDHGNRYGKIKR